VGTTEQLHGDGAVPAFAQVVLRHSADAALLLHPTDGVVYASPAVAHVIGIDPNEFFGKLAADWVHPDDVESAITQRRLAASAGHSGPTLIRGRHGDGTHHWFEAEWWHLATDHTVLHLRDAQRHRSAIEAMRDELTRTTALLEHSQEITFTVHPDDDHVLHMGAAGRRLLGLPTTGSLPRHWRDIVDPADHAAFAMLLLHARDLGTEAIGTVHLIDGTATVPVIVRVHDLTADPRVAALAVIGLRRPVGS
jgi:PAS domain-containing protein